MCRCMQPVFWVCDTIGAVTCTVCHDLAVTVAEAAGKLPRLQRVLL
jgi:hypothetical protein